MNLLKVFNLGGIWENGKRFDSPLGTFQKCKNVFIDKSRRLIPIAFGSAVGSIVPPVNYGISNWVRIIKSIPFANNLFNIYRDWETDRKSTRLNSSHSAKSRMPSSA